MAAQNQPQRIQIELELSPELYETINNLAQQLHGDRVEVILKAIALLEVALEAKQKGKHLWIVNDQDNLETQIVGI